MKDCGLDWEKIIDLPNYLVAIMFEQAMYERQSEAYQRSMAGASLLGG